MSYLRYMISLIIFLITVNTFEVADSRIPVIGILILSVVYILSGSITDAVKKATENADGRSEHDNAHDGGL